MQFVVAFTEPYLLDTRWTFGASIYNQRYRFDTTTSSATEPGKRRAGRVVHQATTGITITTSRPLASLSGGSAPAIPCRESASPTWLRFPELRYSQLIGYVPGRSAYAVSGSYGARLLPWSLQYDQPLLQSDERIEPAGLDRGHRRHFRRRLQHVPAGSGIRKFFPDKCSPMGAIPSDSACSDNTPGRTRIPPSPSSTGSSSAARPRSAGSTSGPSALWRFPALPVRLAGHPIIDTNTGLPLVTRSVISVGGDTFGLINFEYRIPIAGLSPWRPSMTTGSTESLI